MKKAAILFLQLFFLFSLSVYSQSVDIFEANGWLESTCLKWHTTRTVDSYNVYIRVEELQKKWILH